MRRQRLPAAEIFQARLLSLRSLHLEERRSFLLRCLQIRQQNQNTMKVLLCSASRNHLINIRISRRPRRKKLLNQRRPLQKKFLYRKKRLLLTILINQRIRERSPMSLNVPLMNSGKNSAEMINQMNLTKKFRSSGMSIMQKSGPEQMKKMK